MNRWCAIDEELFLSLLLNLSKKWGQNNDNSWIFPPNSAGIPFPRNMTSGYNFENVIKVM